MIATTWICVLSGLLTCANKQGGRRLRGQVAPERVNKPIKPGRIGTVLATLGREIAQDLIPVGAALPPEPDLEARFGVGRGVVREASRRSPPRDLSAFARAMARMCCRVTNGACSIAMS